MTPPPAVLAVGLLLQGRPVLVVGAGPVATAKIERLLGCGARVRVVAPDATATVREHAAAGRLQWLQRRFQPADLDGCHLVLTATGRDRVDAEVFAQCEARCLLCNAADVPEACSVYLMAQEQAGPVTIAAGSSGTAPGLAGRLAREARAGLPADVAELVQAYAALRAWVTRVRLPGPQARRGTILRWLAAQPWAFFRQDEAAQRAAVEARVAASDA